MEPSSSSASSPSAEADADRAWAFACGLDDEASPQRVDAVVNVLVNLWNADCAQMTAAAAVCRARERANGDAVGWRDAVDFLDRAVTKIRDAGAGAAGAAREQFVDGLRGLLLDRHAASGLEVPHLSLAWNGMERLVGVMESLREGDR
jgi:hypothetical protein